MSTWIQSFITLRAIDLTQPKESERMTLDSDPAKCIFLRPTGQNLRLIEGRAWIACNGSDIFLYPGDQIRLPSRGDTAILSGIGPEPLTFDLYE